MSFHVTVHGGEDDGRSFRIDGQCIVGRAPGCSIRLTEPQVAWEHAALQDLAGRLFVQNLSAAGVRMNGQALTSEVRLANGDRVDLADACSLVVEERVGGEERRSRRNLILVAVGLLVAVGIVAGARMLRTEELPPPPMTIDHWRTAQGRLVDRMIEWEARGEFPSEATVLFEDAWRLEIAQNLPGCLERWEALRSVLLTLRVPGDEYRERSIAEAAGTRPRSLDVIMDWATDTSLSMDPRYRTDEAYADALAWFVKKRAERTREKLEAGR